MNEFQLERVFFHELGHYVAHRTNELYFGNLGVKAMRLFLFGEDNRYGEIELNKLVGYREGEIATPVQVERLPQLLASLCHGCFFQSYYMTENLSGRLGDEAMGNFSRCFSHQGDGSDDVGYWRAHVSNSRIMDADQRLVSIENDYFQRLIDHGALDFFMQLKPLDYLHLNE